MKYHIEITPDNLGGEYVGDIVKHIDELSQIFPVKLWEYAREGSGIPPTYNLDVTGQDNRHWKMQHVFDGPTVWLRFDSGATQFTGPESNAFKLCDEHAIYLVKTYPALTKIRLQIIGS